MKSSKLICCTFLLCLTALPVQARMVCWTNNEGVKECGNSLPPEYAEQGHQKLNEQGMVVDETARQKTEEEIAAEKAQETAAAEQERQKLEAARKDEILLYTYSSVEDIEMARDGKLSAIQSSISLTETRNEKLSAELDKLVEQAANDERAGKAPDEALVKDIESLKRQIQANNDHIAEKHAEQDMVKQNAELEAARFKELKSIQ